ncbi:MAG: hypothetical protein MJK04_01290, partial [Psychrosphaera sp.]|nr:hypothetical protein [Psychrosphaera sp.]
MKDKLIRSTELTAKFKAKSCCSTFYPMLPIILLSLTLTGCFGGDDKDDTDTTPPVVVVVDPVVVTPDPSLPTGPTFGDLPEGLDEANSGAFDGGLTGTNKDPLAANVLQAADQREAGKFNIPSNGMPSPL